MVLIPDAGTHAGSAKPGGILMLTAITDVLGEPEAYVCIWRDGELYVEPVADLPLTGTKELLAA